MNNEHDPDKGKTKDDNSLTGCIILGILLSVIFLIIGSIITCSMVASHDPCTPVVREFLDAGESGRFEEAYALMNDVLKKGTTIEETEELFERVSRVSGERLEMKRTYWRKGASTVAGTYADMRYSIKYENGDIYLNVFLSKNGGQWLIQKMHFGSDMFVQDLKCPDCGQINSLESRFCSACGTELKRPDAATGN